MSLLLRSPPPLLPLIAAVAVCDVVGRDAQIKWPNDIVVARPPGLAKVAGILAEGRPQEEWAVLGIGLNVAVDVTELPDGLRDHAASMGLGARDIEPTLKRLLAALADRLGSPAQATLEQWRRRDALHGRTVAWAGGSGRAEGVDGTGRLIIALAGGGRTTLDAGEVHLEQID